MRARAGAWAALLVVVAACGSTATSAPSWRSPTTIGGTVSRDGAPSVRIRHAIDVRLSGAGAAAYNDERAVPVPTDRLSQQLVRLVDQAARAASQPQPVADGRLFAAAGELARVAATNGDQLPYALVEFAMRHHGIVEPSPHLLIIGGTSEPDERLLRQIADKLPRAFEEGPIARVGVGAAKVRSDSDEVVIVLALQASFVETDPIPRTLPRDGTVRIRGRLLGAYGEPHVFVTRDNGAVEQIEVREERNGKISADVPCVGRSGAQRIEIAASDRTGSNVLANFPVYCGEAPPQTFVFEPEPEPDGRPVRDGETAEAVMLDLVNRARAAAGLPSLALDPRLSDIARAHSVEMRETGVVAHVSSRTGSASDRVRAARVQTMLVLENVARAYGVHESQRGLMDSPGHRANVLSSEATHIGIGIVLGHSEDSPEAPEMFVTQLFIRAPRKVSVAQAKMEMAASLIKATGMRTDDELAAIAQTFAERVAAGWDNEKAQKEAAKRLDAVAGNFKSVVTTVTALGDPSAFEAKRMGGRGTTHFGMGVARGAHPAIGDDALFLVILLARAR